MSSRFAESSFAESHFADGKRVRVRVRVSGFRKMGFGETGLGKTQCGEMGHNRPKTTVLLYLRRDSTTHRATTSDCSTGCMTDW